MKKSKFNLSYLNSTTGNAGYLIPFLLQPTLPNDTFRFSLSSFIRAQPMVAPLMHEVKFYTQYWFVPNRIIWDDWEQFITGGGDLTAAPAFPVLKAGTQFEVGSLGDYFGFPTGVDVGGISALPFRAYAEIWNTRYRDEDLQDEIGISYNSGEDSATSLKLMSPSWKRDYFTTSRPFTQRGPQISVPVYTDVPTQDTRFVVSSLHYESRRFFKPNGFSGDYVGNYQLLVTNKQLNATQFASLVTQIPLISATGVTAVASPGSYFWLPVPGVSGVSDLKVLMYCSDVVSGSASGNTLSFSIPSSTKPCNNNYPAEFINTSVTVGDFSGFYAGYKNGSGWDAGSPSKTYPCGYYQASGRFQFNLNQPGQLAGSVNIRDLRASSALQRYAERSLEWGNRYEEFIQREFGIKPRDSRIQRPEYLGGGSGTLQISEVLQTAEGQDTGVGTMRGHGIAGIGQRPIKFRAPEHGIIIGLISIRPKPVYTQGVPREFLKKSRLDFFTPELANIGMQEVLERELYFTPTNGNSIFGYSDRYAEYRYNQPKVTGEFRSTLSFWNMARQFDAPPVLNASFIDMSSSQKAFSRPFSSPSTHQYLMMLRNNIRAYRPVPKRARNILK
nr:MAG: major capsid protein [Microviridae sp.]